MAAKLKLDLDVLNTTLAEFGLVAVPISEKRGNEFFQNVIAARVGCAYGSPECKDKTFAPNGVGSKQHTTCEQGRKAMAAARGQ